MALRFQSHTSFHVPSVFHVFSSRCEASASCSSHHAYHWLLPLYHHERQPSVSTVQINSFFRDFGHCVLSQQWVSSQYTVLIHCFIWKCNMQSQYSSWTNDLCLWLRSTQQTLKIMGFFPEIRRTTPLLQQAVVPFFRTTDTNFLFCYLFWLFIFLVVVFYLETSNYKPSLVISCL